MALLAEASIKTLLRLTELPEGSTVGLVCTTATGGQNLLRSVQSAGLMHVTPGARLDRRLAGRSTECSSGRARSSAPSRPLARIRTSLPKDVELIVADRTLDRGGIELLRDLLQRARRRDRPTAAEAVTQSPPVCVFDLDHTLVSSPLDLKAVGREMEAFVRERGLPLPQPRAALVGDRDASPSCAPRLLTSRPRSSPFPRSMSGAPWSRRCSSPSPKKRSAAFEQLGFATAIWTNNDRVVADFVLGRFDLLRHLDLVVTRDDVTALKPDPDGLRVVRERWPEAPHIVMVGDAWVDGLAAQAGGIPFIAYRADAAELERRGVSVTARITSLLDLPAALA